MPEQRPNERQSIINLQRYLRQLSFDFPTIPQVPIDGFFESVTEQALRAYQSMKGLPNTGRVDLQTWTRLFEDYELSLARNSRGEGFYIFPRDPKDYTLTLGEEHFLVEVIQYILNELRILYDDIPQNGQSGIYDEETKQGLAAFQKRNALPVSDHVDRMTWNALANAHRRMSDGNTQ